ncbi:MAG TPA: glycosyltransferase family 4 protein [Mycobacteriales bacterium]|nr:glycosyltransferase family 4 protein [Mycobacteriales bacterium]
MVVHVAAFPAFANPTGNRYNALLSAALQRLDVTVDEWSPRLWPPRFDIVHVHWPDVPLNIRPPTHAAVRTVQTLESLALSKARGARIVWTAHNVRSHVQRRPRAERRYTAAFDHLVDGWIALSDSSAALVTAAHPALANTPFVVTPHGHYRGAYPDTLTRAAARDHLGLDAHHRVALLLGLIRRYKGADRLIEVFGELTEANFRLLVAGRCDEPDLARQLQRAASDDPRVTLRLESVADDDLQLWLRAADVAVLPYRAVLNSGSALLALTYDVPVLAPGVGSLVELAADVPEWVHLYAGDLTPADLRAALQRPAPSGQPDLHRYDWDSVARQTLEFYQRLVPSNAG